MTESPGGVISPLATPLNRDGSLASHVVGELVDAIISTVDGIFVLGSSGELPWLDDATAVDMVAATVDAVDGRIPVYVGVGDTSTQRTIRRVHRLNRVGVEFLVVSPPGYYPVEPEALVHHFRDVASASDKPLVLYNVPQNGLTPITRSVAESLADVDEIVGIKDSSGDFFAFVGLCELASPQFAVMQGREQLVAASACHGATGVISAMANFAPELLQALWGMTAGDSHSAQVFAIQAEVNDLAGVFEHGYWVSALKSVLSLIGYQVGDPSPPMTPCTGLQRAAIKRILSRHSHHLTGGKALVT